MGAKKYEFKAVYNQSEKLLVCPQCFEMLEQSDIEHYSCCPYCDHKFDMDAEIEDFLLQPLVESWVRRETQSPFLDNIIRVVLN